MARSKQAEPALGWWGTRFMHYMHDVLEAGPLTDSALRSARKAETELRVVPGEIVAKVAVGRYGDFHKASFNLKPLTERQWRKVLDAVAAQPEVAQRLLNGNPGADLEAVMDELLFPLPTRAVPIRCSCRAWTCRHMNALVVHTAALLDANPFIWLEMRGIGRAELQAGIRARLGDAAPVADSGAAIRPEQFWATPTDPASIPVRPGVSQLPDGLLRRLGPLPIPEELKTVALISRQGWHPRPVDEVLRRLVSRMGKQAAALGRGDRAPAYQPWGTPGKEIPTGARLAEEVAEAVRAEGRLLSLKELGERCPTTAGLPDSGAGILLTDALAHLPDDLISLGGRYAGTPEAILSGATFCHVITFDAWLEEALSADADWVKVLTLAGVAQSFQITVGGARQAGQSLWEALQPEVGDELWLTVTDPAVPVLAARMVRRSERSFLDRNRASAGVAKALAQHLRESHHATSEEVALGLVLAETPYLKGGVDPVWLMPYHTVGLRNNGPNRSLASFSVWRPTFGRPYHGVPGGLAEDMRAFQALLIKRGESRRRIEQATQQLQRWWQAGGADPHSPPPLAALLEFLWISGPLDGGTAGLESLPAALADWFKVMAERKPALRAELADHLAACCLLDAYQHRVSTMPERSMGDQVRAWVIEGYRWLGPEHYFAAGPRGRYW